MFLLILSKSTLRHTQTLDTQTRNTIIRQSDARKLTLKENSWESWSDTRHGQTVSYRVSNIALDVLQVDNSLARNTINYSGVSRGKAYVRFAINEATGDIFHMDSPVFIESKISIKLAD